MQLVGKSSAFLVVCLATLSVCRQGVTQDDVFGADSAAEVAPNPANEDAAAVARRTALLNESSVVVRTLLSDPPKTPKELAVAIKLMVRIKRWDEVSRWMKSIAALDLDEKSAIEMVDAAGPRTFAVVEGASQELTDADRNLAQKIIQLANSYRFKPTLLADYASQMRANDSSTRLAGFRGIESTGRYGLVAFFANVMATDASQPTPIMCEALTRLDVPAFEAWSAAIQTPHDDARLQLAKLAFGSRDPKFAPALGALIADSDPSNEAWSPIRESWEQSTPSRNRQELSRLASQSLKERLALYLRTRFANDATTGVRWSLGADGRSVQISECRPSEVMWSHLSFDADNVLRFVAQPDDAAALAYVVMAHNATSTEQQETLRGRAKRWLESPDFCCKAWDLAVQNDLAQAQRVILEDMGKFLVPLPDAVRNRMVGALDSGYSTVRYVAANQLIDYLVTLDASQSRIALFGRSKLERVAKDMVTLNLKPTSYVIGGSASLRNHMSTLLEAANINVLDFNNAGSAISAARQNGAVDQVYIVSNVYEMSLPQLVQRLRATPATAKAPIVMLADSMSSSSVEFLMQDPRLILGSVPPDGTGLAFLLEKVSVVEEQAISISPTERLLWSEKAEAFFAMSDAR